MTPALNTIENNNLNPRAPVETQALYSAGDIIVRTGSTIINPAMPEPIEALGLIGTIRLIERHASGRYLYTIYFPDLYQYEGISLCVLECDLTVL